MSTANKPNERSGRSLDSSVAGRIKRLRNEFDLAILSIFGGSSAIVVGAFAIYRFATGSIIGGIVDVAIALGLSSVVVYAWRGRSVAHAGAVFVAFVVIACIASSIVFGRTAAYWAFVVLSISFVVTGPRVALAGSIVLIAAIASQSALFNTLPERAIFVVTAALITLYGWISKSQYEIQKRQLETLAHHDPLTHAGNRRLMQKTLEGAVVSHHKRHAVAMLAVLDLDHFKSINDRYGHEAGDRVLVMLADIVRRRLSEKDSLFRLGGEEFVVLLNNTTTVQGARVVNDLHQQFNAGMDAISMPVTVSIGWAELLPDDDWPSWLRRADEAMYRAKQAGRNQVIMASAS